MTFLQQQQPWFKLSGDFIIEILSALLWNPNRICKLFYLSSQLLENVLGK